jgi:hypothetical protein
VTNDCLAIVNLQVKSRSIAKFELQNIAGFSIENNCYFPARSIHEARLGVNGVDTGEEGWKLEEE